MITNFIPTKLSVPALGFSRFLLYNLESLPIVFLRKSLGVATQPNPPPPKDFRQQMLASVKLLIEEDAENIKKGLYPEALLNPESPVKHLQRYSWLLVDAVGATLRAKFKMHKKFSKNVKQDIDDLPEYYKRNFHFQTDGYLSEKSAELYGHQTEILFAGTLDLMRRILLAPVLEKINQSAQPMSVFEIGCGTGETSKIVLQSCKDVDLTVLDISVPYIEMARERLKTFSNVKYRVGQAESYNDEKQYDIVFSAFIMHELPEEARLNIIKKSLELLKPGGLMVHIDSLQLGDNPTVDWALIQFPKDFHEPFYTNYIKNPLMEILSNLGLDDLSTRQALMAKSVVGRKPLR